MNTEIILNMIERRKKHFISWQMDNGFKETYKQLLSDQYHTGKHFLATTGLVFLYGTLGFYFSTHFLEGSRFSIFLAIVFIIIASLSTVFFMDSRFKKKANKKMDELIKTNELYSICEEKYSDDFYSQSLDITLKNSLKLHMNKDEWDLLRFYTHEKLTFGSLQKFLLHHKKMNLQSAPIDNDKLIIEATPIYSSVK